MSQLNALFLNCTLKKSPSVSNTRALINLVADHMQDRGVETSVVRVVDFHVEPGVTSNEGVDDEWPEILARIKEANILVIGSPIWFGVRSSVAQQVIERLDGTYDEADPETGQFPLYNTVAGVVITGNEDGAHDVAANTLFNLTHLGCTVPPNADTYWVGPAGPGPSYIKAGQDHPYTKRTAAWMAANLVNMAEILAENPIETNLNQLTDEATDMVG